ncbi:SPFH domain-containing protein [Microbacterium sp. P06]|uniref:SPFH domain-containing protein n=1 Tax=unclassified Microbacterium TaxID=2609290 RepID=UPI00374531AF
MVWFILAIILLAVAAASVVWAFLSKSKTPAIFTGIASVVVALVCMFISTFWSNGVGEAKVMVNSVDRTVVGTIEEPGTGFKPAWVDFVDFDLFSQELKYAGGDTAPSYAGGTVNGREITVSVGGVSGGSTQANVDMTFVYSVNAEKVEDVYEEFRSQERFTEQIVSKQVLSISRQVPAEYSAIDFRGAKRGEVELGIQAALNDRLEQYGVEFTSVTIQDVRYPDVVETALTAIEQANQKAQEAEAIQRTRQVEAETKKIEAQGEADANRILSESLTPEVVEIRRLEALIEVSKNGDLIIDGGEGGTLIQRNAPQ